MIEKGKFYYETPCSDCGASGVYGKHHVKDQPALICSGPGGLRTEVTIAYEAAAHQCKCEVDAKRLPLVLSVALGIDSEIVDAALVEGGNQ